MIFSKDVVFQEKPKECGEPVGLQQVPEDTPTEYHSKSSSKVADQRKSESEGSHTENEAVATDESTECQEVVSLESGQLYRNLRSLMILSCQHR